MINVRPKLTQGERVFAKSQALFSVGYVQPTIIVAVPMINFFSHDPIFELSLGWDW